METCITYEKNEKKKNADELFKCKAEIGNLKQKIKHFKYYLVHILNLVCYLNIYQH